MHALKIVIPGTPVAKGRARAVRRGNFIAHYTPAKTENYENLVKLAAHQAMGDRAPTECPVQLTVRFLMPVPASYSAKRTAACLSGAEMPAKKPDLDNLLKAVKDGLNGVAWKDDAQVVQIEAIKLYSAAACAQVTIQPYSHNDLL